MAYLNDHPPARSQFRCPRRASESGVVVVHTAENTADTLGPDAGAEAVARFIQGRDDPGSYHDICDSDSNINLVDYSCEAFHVGVFSINWHSYGVSAACEADRWDAKSDEWRDGCLDQMAIAAHRYAGHLFRLRRIVIPARRISVDQARQGVPGFIAHGDLDPMRRHDPGAHFPWATFLRKFGNIHLAPPPAPPTPGVHTVAVNLRQLGITDHGGDVASLQILLLKKAGQPIRVDGDFGPATLEAVRNVQRFFGLTPDGVCGARTWPILFL
jgi:hypothetical protein